MRFVGLAVGVALASALMAPSSASAAVTLSAVDDAYVRGGPSANDTFGEETALLIKSQGPARVLRRALIKFDLSSITNPIDAATLSLSLAGNATLDTNVEVYLMDDALEDGWDESTITFNNAPALGSTGFAGTTLLGSFAVSNGDVAGTSYDFSNAALVDALSDTGTDGFITLGLVSTNLSSFSVLSLASSENTTHGGPSLSISVVPLPAALPLIALGLAGFGAYRHRQRRKTA